MKENDLESKILTILQTIARRPEPISIETNLREEIGFDSLTILMALNELDDTFGIEINEEDFKDVITAADVVRLLRENYLGRLSGFKEKEISHET